MITQMKKTIGILLAVCFLMSVTAAAASAVPSVVKEKKTAARVGAGPVVVKDKKTAVLIFQHVKTKIFGHHHHKLHSHHQKWQHNYKSKKVKTAIKAMKAFVNS